MPHLPALPSPQRVADAVYETLRASLLRGRLKPGEALSVPELARQLGVSRSPVRDAVLRLVVDGLAHEQPRKGAVVARLGTRDLLEIHEIRERLESLAARLAAGRIRPADLEALRNILGQQATAVAHGDVQTYLETDRLFHDRIARASGNVRLRHFLRMLHDQMRVALQAVAASPGHIDSGHQDLAAILRALEARDPDGAEAAMRDHIARTRTRVAAEIEAGLVADPDTGGRATESEMGTA